MRLFSIDKILFRIMLYRIRVPNCTNFESARIKGSTMERKKKKRISGFPFSPNNGRKSKILFGWILYHIKFLNFTNSESVNCKESSR